MLCLRAVCGGRAARNGRIALWNKPAKLRYVLAPEVTRGKPVSEKIPDVPERPSLDGLEATWADRWEEAGVYRFDAPGDRAAVTASK